MQKSKFITSHRNRPIIDIGIPGRSVSQGASVEAIDRYVEVLLLEDVVRLYEYRLTREKGKAPETGDDAKTRDLNIEKFTAILNLFNSVIEIANRHIESENYSVVWRAVSVRALMEAANNVKDLPVLKKIGVDLLRKLCDDPSSEEIEAIIRAAEAAIPD